MESSTTRFQRIAIWVIAIVLGIGTLAGFIALIFSNQNSNAQQTDYQQAYAEYQQALQVQADQLSAKYYSEFSPYASEVGEFDASSVTSLQTKDLKVGDGDTLTSTSSFTAYYIGWTPYGKIFDQSINGTKLKAPYTVTGPGTVIQGWTNGVVGMKVGGVRELTIPADQAYGTNPPSGSIIENNMPLRFIIMVVPTPDDVPIPKALQDYLNSQN